MTDRQHHCNHCQRNKLDGKSYSLLPEREMQMMPFEECAIDLIGPLLIQVNENPYESINENLMQENKRR